MTVVAFDHVAIPTPKPEHMLEFYRALGFSAPTLEEWRASKHCSSRFNWVRTRSMSMPPRSGRTQASPCVATLPGPAAATSASCGPVQSKTSWPSFERLAHESRRAPLNELVAGTMAPPSAAASTREIPSTIFLSSSSIAARPDQALQRTNACVMQCASQIARHPSLAAERRHQFDRRRGSVRLSGHLTHELPSLISAPDKRVASRSVDEYCERLARQERGAQRNRLRDPAHSSPLGRFGRGL